MERNSPALWLLHDLLGRACARTPDKVFLEHRKRSVTYEALRREAGALARTLRTAGIGPGDRVAIHFEKNVEEAAAILAVSMVGGIFVVVNPLLKHRQVTHILADSGAACLVTSAVRFAPLESHLGDLPALRLVVLAGPARPRGEGSGRLEVAAWPDVDDGEAGPAAPPSRIPHDPAAIIYTSGSTGLPKGVVVSHRNLVDGAIIVSTYLELRDDDRLISVLPFSFDYGLNQLTSALYVGGSLVLVNYLTAQDIVNAVRKHGVTGMAAVPTIWSQLVRARWTAEDFRTLRYITNSGGVFHESLIREYRRRLPHARIYPMYGLTEAFRSTYLDPDQVDVRPASMGKAIPGVEILVLDEHGHRCPPGQVGELVHRGAVVSLGYWNDPERTREKFRPDPVQEPGCTVPEIVVFSGDYVKTDEEGYLYYVGRRDEMIKCSGFRVSPSEIEDHVLSAGLAAEAVAVGVPDAELGEAIVLFAVFEAGDSDPEESVRRAITADLPAYMVPRRVIAREALPRNANGKVDRAGLKREARELGGA